MIFDRSFRRLRRHWPRGTATEGLAPGSRGVRCRFGQRDVPLCEKAKAQPLRAKALPGQPGDVRSKSRYGDFSDLPQDSLQYVIRAQTLVDRVAAGTTHAAETDTVREREPHVWIPVFGLSLSPCAPKRRPELSTSTGPNA